MKIDEFTTCVVNGHSEPMKMSEDRVNGKLRGVCQCKKIKNIKYFGRTVYVTDLAKSARSSKNDNKNNEQGEK